jgi:predicted MFS family arabinose efflux permease
VFNVAFFLILAIFVPHAVSNLGLSAFGIGLTLAMFGVGMVLGALLAPRIMRALAFGTVVGIGPVSGLGAAVLMALTIWLPTPVLAGASFLMLGAGPILWVISTTTLRQVVTPPQLLGRVSAINIMAYGARPIGAGLGALLAGLHGVETCLVVAAGGFLVQVLVIAVSPAVRLRHQPA